jgi:hypothetical protein
MEHTPLQHGLHNSAILQGVAVDAENKFITVTSQTVTTAVTVEFSEFQFRLHLTICNPQQICNYTDDKLPFIFVGNRGYPFPEVWCNTFLNILTNKKQIQ